MTAASGGINVHADFAAVNVNFWITPDEANLDPEGGGLKVWDVAAPLDWDFEKYNAADSDIRAFLVREGAMSVTIPYRANRAVVFDSDLFHETDTIRSSPGTRTGVSISHCCMAAAKQAGMADTLPDLRRLLAPIGIERFFADYWQKRMLALQLDPGDFARIRDELGPLDIVRLAGSAREGAQAWLANDFVSHSVIPVDASNARKFFDVGATLYFTNVAGRTPHRHGGGLSGRAPQESDRQPVPDTSKRRCVAAF